MKTRIGLDTLNSLEETMTSLAAYLLIAPRKPNKHILGDPEDQYSEGRSLVKMRITQHYTAALMAYGFPSNTPELQQAVEWFAAPMAGDDIDQFEMTKLEGLLNLRPDDPSVEPRLHRLIAHRAPASGLFVLEDSASIFDTLWAVKLLMLARQRGVLNGLLDDVDLLQTIDSILNMGIEDKDLALALRLRFDLARRLEPRHEDQLRGLLDQARQYRYLWGINRPVLWQRLESVIDAMHKRQLTPGMVSDNERDFREVITNSCYVIENLVALMPAYDDILPVLSDCMHLWWRQFEGENAPNALRTLFSEEYNFLLVMFRTVVAVSTFIGEPLGARFWLMPLRRMSSRFDSDTWAERASIDAALRQWIGIDLPDKPHYLSLGLSEADVVRIEPRVYNPLDENRTNLLNESLIVKYGPIAEIETERENYRYLPDRIRYGFVRIPDESYIDETRRAFVIMQDLDDYYTFYEDYEQLLKKTELSRLLADFLLDIHQGAGGAAVASNNHLRDLYMLPLLQYVDSVLNYANALEATETLPEAAAAHFDQAERRLNELMADIMRYQSRIDQFPLAYMHGDLHTRNIMIRVLPRAERPRADQTLQFKLIDLEFLRADGDAVQDLGMLLVDLRLMQASSKLVITRAVSRKIDRLYDDLLAAYRDAYHQDSGFDVRLNLALARASLRIARGRSKRSLRHLRGGDYHRALELLTSIITLTQDSIEYLDAVYGAIG